MSFGYSKTQIFNLALDHLKEQSVTSPTDNTPQAIWLNRNFDLSRDAVLRSHPWNFARRRATLNALTDAPAFQWLYQYALPADFLRLIPLTVSGDPDGAEVPYELEGSTSGLVILTNQTAPLRVRYIARITDTGLFDPLFVQALGAHLAYGMAHWLTGKTSFKQLAAEIYQNALDEAMRVDGLENYLPRPIGDDWLASR